MNVYRIVMFAAVLLAGGFFVEPTEAANTRAEFRAEIQSMPLLERPNRVGHFYGNNVRRIHSRRYGR